MCWRLRLLFGVELRRVIRRWKKLMSVFYGVYHSDAPVLMGVIKGEVGVEVTQYNFLSCSKRTLGV